ncbi:hypothetical protein ACVINY_004033 [Sinorhizobium meliloti]
MTQHLAEIARHVADDADAILIMDQAGWHVSNNLVVPENITILPLSPKSPELNRSKTSGSSCVKTGSPTVSSNPTPTSLTIAARPGANSKASLGE